MTPKCLLCQQLFCSLKEYKATHFRFETLAQSASQGCEVCSALRTAVVRLAEHQRGISVLIPESGATPWEEVVVTGRRTLRDGGTPYDTPETESSEFVLYYERGNTFLNYLRNTLLLQETALLASVRFLGIPKYVTY
jgi:hypothetical protein